MQRTSLPVPRRRALAGGACAVVLLLAAGARSQQPTDEERFKKLDAGPKTIDVSKYPAEQQQAYKLFLNKCAACHAVARGINTEMAAPGDWERYVRRMMRKPNSGINDEDGKLLYRFLVYDSSARKADLLRKQLAALPAEERAAAVEKIKAVNPSFAP